MSHYLVYYKEYWADKKVGLAPNGTWSTKSQRQHKMVRRGDTLWSVALADDKGTGEWRLLERIDVQLVDPNPSPSKWGKYRIIGSNKSKLFKLEPQPDFTAILWLLSFAGGNPIRVKGRKIGLRLQSPFRRLTERSAVLLEEYASALKIDTKTK